MKIMFAQEERDRLTASLLDERQRAFMEEHVRRGKRTAFARELARGKGVHITESMTEEEIERFVDDWILTDFIDAGPDYAGKGYKCECGRTLRYVYAVRHKQSGEQVRLGKEHFEEHTRIPAGIVKRILQGMDAIDYEMDELLLKLHDGWSFDKAFPQMPPDFVLPEDIGAQLALYLPLLDRQIEKLRHMLRRHDYEPVKSAKRSEVNDQAMLFTAEGVGSSVSPTLAEPQAEESAAYQNEPFQFAFDFDLDSPPVPQPKPAAAQAPATETAFFVPMHATANPEVSIIRTFLKEGMQSARAMAEMLITREGYPDSRFVTGKPRLYPRLCSQLDRLVAAGEAALISADPSHEDRLYRCTK